MSIFLSGQKIVLVETEWQDSFDEWNIYTEGDSIDGSLELTWKLDNDWTVWQFNLGELNGTARIKYSNNPNLWEFRAQNEIITAKTIWNNDFTEWRFTDGRKTIKLKSRYRDWPVVWFSEGEENGFIDIYMEYEDNPNIWIVEDELNEDISLLYRIALIFIPVFHSTPKY